MIGQIQGGMLTAIWTFTIFHQTLLSKVTNSLLYIHSYTDGGGCHERCRPAHQEQGGLGFSVLPKDSLTCKPGELNQQPSNNKMLALPPETQSPYKACTSLTSNKLPHYIFKLGWTVYRTGVSQRCEFPFESSGPTKEIEKKNRHIVQLFYWCNNVLAA